MKVLAGAQWGSKNKPTCRIGVYFSEGNFCPFQDGSVQCNQLLLCS